jgi:DNA repair photolyase
MSPVHSLSAPSFRTRPRHVSPTTVELFPECPGVISPKQVVQGPAPAADPLASGRNTASLTGDRNTVDRSSDSNPPATDCPPASTTLLGTQSRSAGPIRIGAANSSQRANARLVGIARLAAFSPPAETRRKSAEKPEYFLLPVKSILNQCDSKRVPFEWTINPYRGCEFACKYCYARYTHEYMELDGSEFEKKIYVKKDVAPLLAWDVSHKYSYTSKASGGARPDHIAIGTATDPYQPAEREYGVTRSCLEELAKREGLSVSIITKSNQIVRDIDVLQRISERSNLGIDITITTLRAGLTRLLEPRAPRPDLRLAAVKQLREAGLAVGVSASPLIPGITDRDGDLEAVAAAAKEAGAQWFFSGVLFLMPSSAKQFLPFVREKFPRLAKQYEDWYAKNGYAPEEYRKKASQRVARIREKFGFAARPWVENKHVTPCVQLPLNWDAAAVAQEIAGTRSCAAG